MENRETFFARLTPFMPPSELRMVEIAYMMAKYGHRAQVRKDLDLTGTPIRYFEHVRGVALILIDELGIRDWRQIVVALLHDTLEDTKDITPEIIEHVFDATVCQRVKILSKVPKEGYLERLKTYGDPHIFIVKGADRLHNLRSMKDCTPEFIAKQVEETQMHIQPILRYCEDKTVQEVYHKIRSVLNDLGKRLNAVV